MRKALPTGATTLAIALFTAAAPQILFQEVMHHGPLVVVRHNSFGLGEDVARKRSCHQQVDDGVVESAALRAETAR